VRGERRSVDRLDLLLVLGRSDSVCALMPGISAYRGASGKAGVPEFVPNAGKLSRPRKWICIVPGSRPPTLSKASQAAARFPSGIFSPLRSPYPCSVEPSDFFFADRRSPLTPARGRGFDCGLEVEWAWRIELAAGQVLRATACSASLVYCLLTSLLQAPFEIDVWEESKQLTTFGTNYICIPYHRSNYLV